MPKKTKPVKGPEIAAGWSRGREHARDHYFDLAETDRTRMSSVPGYSLCGTVKLRGLTREKLRQTTIRPCAKCDGIRRRREEESLRARAVEGSHAAFLELETRTLAAGAKREPVESMTFAEMYGGTAPARSREEFLADQNAAQVAKRLRMLTPSPPLAPPTPGVEPATAFAERLARKLCIFGEPPDGLIIEILKAVRERDAALVKAIRGSL